MADDAVCCELLPAAKFPDHQGKYREFRRFRSDLRIFEMENCFGSRCLFLKFPKIRNKELILNNREIFGGIRESNEAIREPR